MRHPSGDFSGSLRRGWIRHKVYIGWSGNSFDYELKTKICLCHAAGNDIEPTQEDANQDNEPDLVGIQF